MERNLNKTLFVCFVFPLLKPFVTKKITIVTKKVTIFSKSLKIVVDINVDDSIIISVRQKLNGG